MELIVNCPQEAAVEKRRAKQVVGIGFLVRTDVLLEVIKACDGVEFR